MQNAQMVSDMIDSIVVSINRLETQINELATRIETLENSSKPDIHIPVQPVICKPLDVLVKPVICKPSDDVFVKPDDGIIKPVICKPLDVMRYQLFTHIPESKNQNALIKQNFLVAFGSDEESYSDEGEDISGDPFWKPLLEMAAKYEPPFGAHE